MAGAHPRRWWRLPRARPRAEAGGGGGSSRGDDRARPNRADHHAIGERGVAEAERRGHLHQEDGSPVRRAGEKELRGEVGRRGCYPWVADWGEREHRRGGRTSRSSREARQPSTARRSAARVTFLPNSMLCQQVLLEASAAAPSAARSRAVSRGVRCSLRPLHGAPVKREARLPRSEPARWQIRSQADDDVRFSPWNVEWRPREQSAPAE